MKEREEEKKKRQQLTATEEKALAILDAKASCFEDNDYKGVSVPDLTALLAWYNIPKEKMNKSQMVAKWKEIRLNHVPPPIFEKWGDSDEEELIRLNSSADQSVWTLFATDRNTSAILAVILLALSPIDIIFAQMSRQYSLLVLLTIISQLLLLKCLKKRRQRVSKSLRIALLM